MKILLTSEARELVTSSVKDPAISIHRAGCTRSGRGIAAEYASKTSVDALRQWGFEEVGEVEGVSVFMDG
ncbi:MAG: hypothetical protein QW587_03380 [Candidatus Bathyarchaeia archaeon]